MLKRRFLGYFLGISLLALFVWRLLPQRSPSFPPVVVNAAQVVLAPWQESIQAIGTLSANQSIVIKPETSGRITAIYFRSGEQVKAGTPLLQLSSDGLNAKWEASKTQTQLSALEYKRSLTLYRQKVLAKADLDKAEAAYLANQANEAEAKAALDQTLVKAPFSGRLGLRLVNQGDYLAPSQAIVNLDAINPLRVDFRIPDNEATKVRIGTKVVIQAATYPDKRFISRVYASDSQIDVSTQSLGVRARLDNPEQQLVPGTFVNLWIQVDPKQRVPTVPETAVNNDEQGSYVYRIIQHKAIKTPVTVLFHQDGMIGLTGIQPGEQIVSIGGFKVRDQSPLIIGR